MMVGVMNKKFNNSKLIGSVINYTLTGGDIKIKMFLDLNKRKLTVFTPSKPDGEIFNDLPKDGQFYPAIQNKTNKTSNNTKLKVLFQFDKTIPKDKTKVRYESEEDESDSGGMLLVDDRFK